MRKVHLIANSNSGKGAGATIKDMAEEVCQELNFELVSHEIEDKNTALEYCAV